MKVGVGGSLVRVEGAGEGGGWRVLVKMGMEGP